MAFGGGSLWLRLHDKEQSQPVSSLLIRNLLEPFLTKTLQHTNFAQMIKFIKPKRTHAMGVCEVRVHTGNPDSLLATNVLES